MVSRSAQKSPSSPHDPLAWTRAPRSLRAMALKPRRMLLVAGVLVATVTTLTHVPLFSRKVESYPYSADLGFPVTRMLAHVPGYTVLENAYWCNGKVQIFTEEPWSFADPESIAQRQDNTRGASDFVSDVEMVHIVDDPWSADVRPGRLKHTSMSHDKGIALTKSAIEIPGVTLATLDDQFLGHYYHFVGEIFLPMWKIWTKAHELFGRPEAIIDNLIFFNANSDTSHSGWEDRPGVNVYTIRKAFPDIAISAVEEWGPRAATSNLYHFPYMMLFSRRAGHEGPNSANKPFGDAIRMPVGSRDWWGHMRDRLLQGHQSHYLQPTKPVITYLSRQSTGRRLSDASHDALNEELSVLQRAGLVEYHLEEFEHLPIPEQWARIARTTILVSVHGNGLTHLVMMRQRPEATVYEIQPDFCHMNDYSPLATLIGVQHFMVRNDTMCAPVQCGRRGCQEGTTVNRGQFDVDARLLVNHIRSRLDIPPRR